MDTHVDTGRARATSDIVIVGGGLAGLFCALKLAPRPVTLIATAPLGQGSASVWAQGGIAAAVAPGDSAQAHADDTIAAGAGLVDEAVAYGLAAEAAAQIDDLLRLGVPFDRDREGRLAVSREAAHSAHRVVRVGGDRAGQAIMAALVRAVRDTPSIRVREGVSAEALLTENGAVVGLQLRGTGAAQTVALLCPAVVLATGGIGHLFAATTSPAECSGSGLAIAARAGALIADPEFVQFHPTAMMVGCDPAPLATEALRGEGATLINRCGDRFMLARHRLGELAPRDIVARGVFAEIAAGRGAFLDVGSKPGARFAEHFPTVHQSCLAAGIDPATQPIPIAPAAHYHMGGIAVDMHGRSSLKGLWAAGEVSCTGAHGANRLASNSLLEAAVYAARIAEDIGGREFGAPAERFEPPDAPPNGVVDHAQLAELRQLMSTRVGVIRSGDGLAAAVRRLAEIEARASSAALLNTATAALLVASAAWARIESRGAHFRADYPAPNPALADRTLTTLREARDVAASLAEPALRRVPA